MRAEPKRPLPSETRPSRDMANACLSYTQAAHASPTRVAPYLPDVCFLLLLFSGRAMIRLRVTCRCPQPAFRAISFLFRALPAPPCCYVGSCYEQTAPPKSAMPCPYCLLILFVLFLCQPPMPTEFQLRRLYVTSVCARA